MLYNSADRWYEVYDTISCDWSGGLVGTVFSMVDVLMIRCASGISVVHNRAACSTCSSGVYQGNYVPDGLVTCKSLGVLVVGCMAW